MSDFFSNPLQVQPTPRVVSGQTSTCRTVLSVGVGIRGKPHLFISYLIIFLCLIKNSIIMSKKNLTQEQGDSIKEIVGKIIDLIVKLTKGK